MSRGAYNLIRDIAVKRGVDPDLAEAVLHQESRGKAGAVSPKGAKGLMQTMPATLHDPGFGVKPAQSDAPEELARVGVDYLGSMLKRYNGNVNVALAAYNAGPGTADKYGAKVPIKETQDYVKKITKHFKNLKSGSASSAADQPVEDEDPYAGLDSWDDTTKDNTQLPKENVSLAESAVNAAFPAAQASEAEDADAMASLNLDSTGADNQKKPDNSEEDPYAGLDSWDDAPAATGAPNAGAGADNAPPKDGLDDLSLTDNAETSAPGTEVASTNAQPTPPKPSVNLSGSLRDAAISMGYDPEQLAKGGADLDQPVHNARSEGLPAGNYEGKLGRVGYGFSKSALNLRDLAAKATDSLIGNTKPEELMNNKFQQDLLEAEYKAARTKDGADPESFDPYALAGSMAAPVPLSKLKGIGVLGKAGAAALAGGSAGLMYGDANVASDDYWSEKLKGTALGAAGGGIVGGGLAAAGKVGSKVYNAITGKMTDEATSLQQLSDDAGMRMLASDALPSGKVNDTLAAVMDVLPVVGTGTIRKSQTEALAKRAASFADEATTNAKATPYEAVKGMATAAKVKGSREATSKAIQDDAGNDLGKIIGASADLMTVKEARHADKLYGKFRDLGNKTGASTTYDNLGKSLDEQVTKLEQSKFRDDTLIEALKIASSKIKRGSAMGVDDVLETRTTIKTLLDKANDSTLFTHGPQAVKALTAVKSGLDTDIAAITGGPRTKLAKALAQADEFERVVVKGRDGAKLTTALAAAKETGDFDEVANLIMRPHLVDRAAKSASLLDQKGKQALLASMMNHGVQMAHANGTGEFNSKTMATFLNKNMPTIGKLGGPDYTRQVEGYKRLLQHMNIKSHDNKMTLGSTPIVGGALGAGLYSSAAMLTPKFLASAAGMSLLFRSEAGKRLLLASSKTPIGSERANQLIGQLGKMAEKAAVTTTAQPQ